MHIKIFKYVNDEKETIYKADCLDLCGTPPAPEAKTAGEAVAKLFYLLIVETRSNATPDNWLRLINSNKFTYEESNL